MSIKDIATTELGKTFTVVIGEEDDKLTISCSVLDYCAAVIRAHSGDYTGKTDEQKAKDEKAVNAMAAFYEYYKAAKEYVTKTFAIPTFKEEMAPLYDSTVKSVDDVSYWNGYDPKFMTIKNFTATEIGTYSATFSLKQNTLSKWSDGTTEDKTAEWCIVCDYAVLSNGTLTFKRGTETGSSCYLLSDAQQVEDAVVMPWFYERENITSVVFDESFARCSSISCAYWFAGCENLAQVSGLQYLNLSDATSTQSMFYGCASLSKLNSDSDGFFDLSSMDMSKITDASGMFADCDSMTVLIGPYTSFASSGCSLEVFAKTAIIWRLLTSVAVIYQV